MLIASTEGGMEIEKVADETPDLINQDYIDPAVGLQSYKARNSRSASASNRPSWKAIKLMLAIYRVREDRRLARRDQSAGHHGGR